MEAHDADVLCKSSKFNEQDVGKILAAVDRSLNVLEEKYSNYLSNVKCIGVSGQMHGCVLWKSSKILSENYIENFSLNEIKSSNLITWQDQRADENFIRSLPTPEYINYNL